MEAFSFINKPLDLKKIILHGYKMNRSMDLYAELELSDFCRGGGIYFL